jgi:PilZ domain-containing protein
VGIFESLSARPDIPLRGMHNLCATPAAGAYNPLTLPSPIPAKRRLAMAPQERREPSKPISPATGTERQQTERREQRSDVQLPLTVYGFAATGKLFVEICSTRNVSHSGCCIRLQARPQADSALALRPLRWGMSSKGATQFLFQIAWVRQDGDGWFVGLSSLGAADLYCLAFPGTP